MCFVNISSAVPSDTLMSSIDAIVEAIATGCELEIATGDDMRHSLELALALRESARRDGPRVLLPLEDRSLTMFPERWRWHYKKDVYGADWYRDQMAAHIQRDRAS